VKNAVFENYMYPGPKLGRNDPCPCGSGKKYKKCHGASVSSGWGASKASSGQPEKLAGAILPGTSKLLLGAVCLALGLATLAVYLQTSGHGFIRFDDDQYVYENPMVRAGLTTSGLAWAFATFSAANWHPLTWLSHMLDCQLFGLDAGAHHLVNVAFHLANSLLLFLACAKMTRRPWRSVVVAGIFALHPLHVESVAWVAERKDVLSTFFGMLALLLYVLYTEAATAWRYIAMASFFALSLMAKPMLVTFPLLLLLLDFWPLRRMEWPPSWPILKHLLREKAPLLAMAAASSAVTIYAQRGDPMISLTHLSIPARFANATVAYASYMGKAFWPANLAVLYPFHAPPGRERPRGLGDPRGRNLGIPAAHQAACVSTGWLALVLGHARAGNRHLAGWVPVYG